MESNPNQPEYLGTIIVIERNIINKKIPCKFRISDITSTSI